MEVQEIIAELDQEIARLKEVRSLLAGEGPARARRGRPARSAAPSRPAHKKSRLTPEGRRRISEALKRRWAARRKAKAQKSAKNA